MAEQAADVLGFAERGNHQRQFFPRLLILAFRKGRKRLPGVRRDGNRV